MYLFQLPPSSIYPFPCQESVCSLNIEKRSPPVHLAANGERRHAANQYLVTKPEIIETLKSHHRCKLSIFYDGAADTTDDDYDVDGDNADDDHDAHDDDMTLKVTSLVLSQ